MNQKSESLSGRSRWRVRWHRWRAARIQRRIDFLGGYPEGMDRTLGWQVSLLELDRAFHLAMADMLMIPRKRNSKP